MTIKERIGKFNRENSPFYLVEHDNGTYSLCNAIAFNKGDYTYYGQEAFDAYAEERGESVMDGSVHRYGTGHDWEAAFREAFKDHPRMKEITLDCELSGFFCYSGSLDLMEEVGRKFKEICDDHEQFKQVVSTGMKKAHLERTYYENNKYKMKYRLLEHISSAFDVKTKEGIIHLEPGDVEALLDGDVEVIRIGDTSVRVREFLEQEAHSMQRNLFANNTFMIITDEAEEIQRHQAMNEEESEGVTQQMM